MGKLNLYKPAKTSFIYAFCSASQTSSQLITVNNRDVNLGRNKKLSINNFSLPSLANKLSTKIQVCLL